MLLLLGILLSVTAYLLSGSAVSILVSDSYYTVIESTILIYLGLTCFLFEGIYYYCRRRNLKIDTRAKTIHVISAWVTIGVLYYNQAIEWSMAVNRIYFTMSGEESSLCEAAIATAVFVIIQVSFFIYLLQKIILIKKSH